jgi:hypothetical protein
VIDEVVFRFVKEFGLAKEDFGKPKLDDYEPLEGSFYTNVVAWELDSDPDNLIRIKVLGDDAYEITDLSLPSVTSKRRVAFKQDVPKFMIDAVSVLSICNNNESIPNIGKRVSQFVFYVVEKHE